MKRTHGPVAGSLATMKPVVSALAGPRHRAEQDRPCISFNETQQTIRLADAGKLCGARNALLDRQDACVSPTQPLANAGVRRGGRYSGAGGAVSGANPPPGHSAVW